MDNAGVYPQWCDRPSRLCCMPHTCSAAASLAWASSTAAVKLSCAILEALCVRSAVLCCSDPNARAVVGGMEGAVATCTEEGGDDLANASGFRLANSLSSLSPVRKTGLGLTSHHRAGRDNGCSREFSANETGRNGHLRSDCATRFCRVRICSSVVLHCPSITQHFKTACARQSTV